MTALIEEALPRLALNTKALTARCDHSEPGALRMQRETLNCVLRVKIHQGPRVNAFFIVRGVRILVLCA